MATETPQQNLRPLPTAEHLSQLAAILSLRKVEKGSETDLLPYEETADAIFSSDMGAAERGCPNMFGPRFPHVEILVRDAMRLWDASVRRIRRRVFEAEWDAEWGIEMREDPPDSVKATRDISFECALKRWFGKSRSLAECYKLYREFYRDSLRDTVKTPEGMSKRDMAAWIETEVTTKIEHMKSAPVAWKEQWTEERRIKDWKKQRRIQRAKKGGAAMRAKAARENSEKKKNP